MRSFGFDAPIDPIAVMLPSLPGSLVDRIATSGWRRLQRSVTSPTLPASATISKSGCELKSATIPRRSIA
jgi:hypothetical protein